MKDKPYFREKKMRKMREKNARKFSNLIARK